MSDAYQQLFDQSPGIDADILSRIILGNMVIDHEQVAGMRGRSSATDAVVIYRLGKTLIEKVWIYGE